MFFSIPFARLGTVLGAQVGKWSANDKTFTMYKLHVFKDEALRSKVSERNSSAITNGSMGGKHILYILVLIA